MYFYLNFIFLFGLLSNASALGKFWHLSDLHLDSNYSLVGDPYHMCHVTNNISINTGKFGNILCDSPYELVKSALAALAKEEPNPDFIIWTGDNTAHIHTEWPAIYEVLSNLSATLQATFPNIAILPTIGNHDTFPANQLPPYNSTILYENFLDLGGWGQLSPLREPEARETFLQGGYYAASFYNGKLRILNLNTILWYASNPQVVNETDPNGQLKWLENQLKQAKGNKTQVYLTGHIPPGQEGGIRTRFHPRFENAYLSLMAQYQDIIISQLYGHLHRDSIRLYSNRTTGEVFGSVILASSVTPWYDPAWPGWPVNPTIRLVDYRASSDFMPEDYRQYYLDLNEANKQGIDNWQLLYRFREKYSEIPDLSTASLIKLLSLLAPSPERRLGFSKDYTSGMIHGKPIDPLRLLCEVAQTTTEGFNLCVRSCVQNAACHTGEDFLKPPPASPSGPAIPSSGLTTIQVIVIVSAALIIIGITFYIGRRKLRRLQDQQNFEYTRF